MSTEMQEVARVVIVLAVIAWLTREAFLTWHAVDLFDARSYRRSIRAVASIMGLLALFMLVVLVRGMLA